MKIEKERERGDRDDRDDRGDRDDMVVVMEMMMCVCGPFYASIHSIAFNYIQFRSSRDFQEQKTITTGNLIGIPAAHHHPFFAKLRGGKGNRR